MTKKEIAALKAASKALHALVKTGLIYQIDQDGRERYGADYEPLYIHSALSEIDDLLKARR